MKRVKHEVAYSLDGTCTNMAEEYFSRLRRAEAGHHHHIAGAYLLRYTREASGGDNRRVANSDQLRRLAALATMRETSVDFVATGNDTKIEVAPAPLRTSESYRAMTQHAEYLGNHHREPWSDHQPCDVLVHARNGKMRGTYRRSESEAKPFVERYERAKRKFDFEAAADIVEDCINFQVIDLLIDRLLMTKKPALVVMPHPQFDNPKNCPHTVPSLTNAIPPALAAYIAEELGCDIAKEIIEVARPGRTALNMFERFLWQPCFEGEVRHDRAYILVDDVTTNGGTLSALRSHIVANGGTVIAATTLAHREGKAPPLRLTDGTLSALDVRFGNIELNELIEKEVGHGIRCLTEGEGSGLVEWGSAKLGALTGGAAVQRLREELAEAANRGNH